MKKKERFLGNGIRWLAVAGFALAAAITPTAAYEQYSTNRADNCADSNCHGDFRGFPYVSPKDNQQWPDSLMDVHQAVVEFDCEVCHSQGGRFPVFTGSSRGGTGIPAISCAGCHGRSADGTGTGSEGYGAGLRQHHFRAGTTICLDCHNDADPANKTPVGEDVLPDYYGAIGTYPSISTDPCNPAPGFNENLAGTTIGLDNDGDDSYDEADTDCGATAGTPGEALQLLVTAHNPLIGTMDLSFGVGCLATDHTLEFGDLADVSTHTYAGQVCNLGTTGTFTWSYPLNPSSLFFLVVATDSSVEGSYGTDGSGAERPEDAVSATCPLPQDLANRCD